MEFDFNIEGSLRWFEVTVARSSVDEVIIVIHEVTDSRIKEKLTQDRLNFVEQIGDISSRLIGVPIDQIDDSITDALEFVAKYTSVDRAYIFELEESVDAIRLSYEWTRDGIGPISSVIPRVEIAHFDAYREKLEKGVRIVSTIDPEILKTYNPVVQNLINSLETKSFANLPLIE